MLKKITLAIADLRAQYTLFLAEIGHYNAKQVLHEAREEIDRAMEMARITRQGLAVARDEARLAEMNVRRQRQRAAMGLR